MVAKDFVKVRQARFQRTVSGVYEDIQVLDLKAPAKVTQSAACKDRCGVNGTDCLEGSLVVFRQELDLKGRFRGYWQAP